ncbi:MAG: RNA polymerase sigma factor [Prolixibacteraceae bacterium]|jgi:RNA polymerase sigma factor (sigma-70 family)
MARIEVLDPVPDISPDIWTEASVKEKLNISEVIHNHGSRLHGFIRKRVRTIEDADDILQDVYFQLADADRLMKPIDQIAAWLYTVARNKITDLYRKKKTESLPEYSDNDDDVFGPELSDLMFDDGSTPETEYLRSLVWTELDKALEELPEEQRQVFELTEMKGLSFKEISEQTGVSVNTLLSRKRYAVLYLRVRLQELYDELINFKI